MSDTESADSVRRTPSAVLSPQAPASRRVPARPAPKLGQDTEAILAELGYDRAAIAELRAQGVI